MSPFVAGGPALQPLAWKSAVNCGIRIVPHIMTDMDMAVSSQQ